MPKSVPFHVQLAEANNTLEAKGLVLSRWDKSLVKADKSRFKSLTVKDGFWFTLGEILHKILQESGGNRMDSALLKNANLHTVAKQRRQEALKFFQNFDFIVENDLLGKFASMKALLSEVAKLQKPKAEVTEGGVELMHRHCNLLQKCHNAASQHAESMATDTITVVLQLPLNNNTQHFQCSKSAVGPRMALTAAVTQA